MTRIPDTAREPQPPGSLLNQGESWLGAMVFSKCNPEAVMFGVDWYTATIPMDTACAAAAAEVMIDVLSRHEREGNKRKERSLNGFEGSMVGGNFIGIKGDLLLVQLTSDKARDFWFLVHATQAHVARLDVQVTTRFDVMPSLLGQFAREDARRHNLTRKDSARRSISIREDDDGGYTLYLGSAQSQQFGRIYNKEAEAGEEYARCWRYEVVLRNTHATELARYLATHTEQERHLKAYVANWFHTRGVDAAWAWSDAHVPVIQAPKEKTDAERALKWLMSQVAPTVRWLLNYHSRDTLSSYLLLDAGPLGPEEGVDEESDLGRSDQERFEHAP